LYEPSYRDDHPQHPLDIDADEVERRTEWHPDVREAASDRAAEDGGQTPPDGTGRGLIRDRPGGDPRARVYTFVQ